MIQVIYWILAIIVMIILLVNGVYTFYKNIENERDLRQYKEKQKSLLEEQIRKIEEEYEKEIKEIL